jgi:drug/metabolite transporter (DMT)-like permease
VAVLLGVLVALCFGSGDFVGGQSSARSSVIGTLVISQACALVGAVALAVLVAGNAAGHDVVLGALAGAINVVGIGLLYRGLARYRAGVVAPVTAVVAAFVPVVWGFARGERPSVVAMVGVVIAVGAGALIAREPGSRGSGWAAGALTAVLAGSALGVSLVFYAETSTKSGMWPVFAARTTSALLVWGLALVLIARRRPAGIPKNRATALAIGAGVLDVSASALLLIAVRRGLVVIVAPIASLAPGVTVVLAWLILSEQLRPAQRVGILGALLGVVLVALG